MSTQAIKVALADFVTVELDVMTPDMIAIAARMLAINNEARMNGYNWHAFFDRYLAMNEPVLLERLSKDPEPGSFVALYENDALGNKKATLLVMTINRLIADPARIYAFLQEEGDGVEWE